MHVIQQVKYMILQILNYDKNDLYNLNLGKSCYRTKVCSMDLSIRWRESGALPSEEDDSWDTLPTEDEDDDNCSTYPMMTY